MTILPAVSEQTCRRNKRCFESSLHMTMKGLVYIHCFENRCSACNEMSQQSLL